VAKIAFLGAGNMGRGMIRNLLKGGHDVAVYNRTPEKALSLVSDGARLYETPREAVAKASVILSMLIDDGASRACWAGSQGVLSAELEPNVLGIECSSVSREWIIELARLGGSRITFVDCPVAGRPDAAAAGELKIFAGGLTEHIERARALLKAFSTSVTHFGPLGSGVTFKLIYNMLGASQIAAVAEALYACDRLNIDIAAAGRVFSEGNTASPHVVRHVAWMTAHNHPDPPQFRGEGRIKDLVYARDLLKTVGISSLTGEAALELFKRMRVVGIAEENDSRVFDAMRLACDAI
jgi:3-hydroxyisobutyrate dehydrogenase